MVWKRPWLGYKQCLLLYSMKCRVQTLSKVDNDIHNAGYWWDLTELLDTSQVPDKYSMCYMRKNGGDLAAWFCFSPQWESRELAYPRTLLSEGYTNLHSQGKMWQNLASDALCSCVWGGTHSGKWEKLPDSRNEGGKGFGSIFRHCKNYHPIDIQRRVI